MSHLLWFCQETWSPTRSSALQIGGTETQAGRVETEKVGDGEVTGTLTVAAPLQVSDLPLQAGQQGQVLVLQEDDVPLHTGHLLLQPLSIHG